MRVRFTSLGILKLTYSQTNEVMLHSHCGISNKEILLHLN